MLFSEEANCTADSVWMKWKLGCPFKFTLSLGTVSSSGHCTSLCKKVLLSMDLLSYFRMRKREWRKSPKQFFVGPSLLIIINTSLLACFQCQVNEKACHVQMQCCGTNGMEFIAWICWNEGNSSILCLGRGMMLCLSLKRLGLISLGIFSLQGSTHGTAYHM